MKERTCQIATHPTTSGPIPYCGKPATWSSDDVSRDGSTVWMCDEHQAEMSREIDDGHFDELDDVIEKRREFAEEYARDAAREALEQ